MPYFILKWIMVFLLMLAGATFLALGLGVQIPRVKYHALEAYGVPAGVALLAAGVALAALWKITREITVTEDSELTGEDGSTVTTHSVRHISTTMNPPGEDV